MLVGVLLGHLSGNLNGLPFSSLLWLLRESWQPESGLALFAVRAWRPIGLLDLLQIAGLVVFLTVSLIAVFEGVHGRLCDDVSEAIPSLSGSHHFLVHYLRWRNHLFDLVVRWLARMLDLTQSTLLRCLLGHPYLHLGFLEETLSLQLLEEAGVLVVVLFEGIRLEYTALNAN